MTEEKVSFLYKAATALSASHNPHSLQSLQSYYLMRCHQLTRILPVKQFSQHMRCSHCCKEWRQGEYDNKVLPVNLTKKQKRRIRTLKETVKNKEYLQKRKDLLHSNQLERICKLCKHKTVITMLKPTKQLQKSQCPPPILKSVKKDKMKNEGQIAKNSKIGSKGKPEINVYCQSQDIFSLKNNDNTISGQETEKPKINNNKKKKDKFAGLCKEAVLASAKLKKKSDNKNKLNLFLKPSS